MIKKVYKEYRV